MSKYRKSGKSGARHSLNSAESGSREKSFHPAYGAMRGLVRIMPGTDLTAPADLEWADRLCEESGPRKELRPAK
jgi:hypothetical protein